MVPTTAMRRLLSIGAASAGGLSLVMEIAAMAGMQAVMAPSRH
jgi:hypothetical protein